MTDSARVGWLFQNVITPTIVKNKTKINKEKETIIQEEEQKEA